MLESLFGKKAYQSIAPSEVNKKLSAGQDFLLLDVRTPEEYREIHIPKSKSLPLDRLKSGIAELASDKSTEIIVYCLSGMRAATACSQLAAMGYTNVSNMGGIQSWHYETEKGN